MRLVKPHWWRLLLAMIFMGLVAAATAAVAFLIKPLLDEVFIAQQQDKLMLIPAGVLAVYILKGVFFFAQAYYMNFVGLSVVNDLRVNLYNHMQRLSLSFFHRHSTGVLTSRLTNDVNLIQAAVSDVVTTLIMDTFTILGLVFVIFYRDWKLAIFGIFIIPMAIYPLYYFGRRLRRLAHEGQEVMGDLTTIIQETIQGARIVKAFNMEEYEMARFAKESYRRFSNAMRTVAIRSISSPFMESLGGLCAAGIIWYGGYQVIEGNATPGSFVSFMTALLLLYEPIKRVTRLNVAIQNGVAAAQRVYAILDETPDIVDRPGSKDLPPIQNNIEFHDVWFAYQDEEYVLRNINLNIRAGEVLALVGVSGGGKTSLVNLIPRFYDVTRGALTIDGRDVRDVTMKSLRAQIAVVSQHVILFNDTVKNNIAYGSGNRSDEEVHAAAKASYAYDFIKNLPQGFETTIGEGGLRLSGGERQRVAMARALLKNAPILILDEATSSLDTQSELYVQRALENLMRGRTVVVIAHRLSTIRHADRIVVIKRGEIVETGDHDQLIEADGEYKRLYDMQFQVDDGLARPDAASSSPASDSE
jgi:subfamily B ATP-binding cassette protein MsbA